jgi:two-component system, chemotaxis family, chemotaxis protein CheY
MSLHFRSLAVLVAEDLPSTLLIVCKLLRQIGVQDLEAAHDGAEALRLAGQAKYGLILSDLHMGPHGGLDLLKAVRADRRLRSTVFIMTSVDMSADAVAEVRQAGADGYLLKPYDAETLREKIIAAFRARNLERLSTG